MEPLRPSRIGDAGKGLIPMALITPPRELPVQGDRSLECELALDLPLRQLVDDAISAGWEPNEVFGALTRLTEKACASTSDQCVRL